MTEEIEMRKRRTEVQEEKDDDEDDEDEEEEDEVDEYTSCATIDNKGEKEEEVPLWNYSRSVPKSEESISTADNRFIELSISTMKLLAYILTFCGVLFGAVFSKLGMLLMTSQLAPNNLVTVGLDNQFFQLELPQEERYLWVWALFIAYSGPEIGTFIRSFRHIMFKSHTMHDIDKEGQTLAFAITFVMESLHAAGMSLLVFEVLPQIDSVRGAMLTNCVCLIPAILGALSYNKYNWRIGVDVAAIIFQLSGLVLWPVLEMNSGRRLWLAPVSLFLISCGWWMNFVSDNSQFSLIRALGRAKDKLKENITLYRLYIWLSLCKIVVFGLTTCGILALQGVDLQDFFENFDSVFSNNRTMAARKLEEVPGREFVFLPVEETYPIETIGLKVLWIVAFQMFCSYVSYGLCKFSYKVMISSFSFAFPVILVVPVTVAFIMNATVLRNSDPAVFKDVLAPYVFFDVPTAYTGADIFIDKFAVVWFLWLFSQVWITRHVWAPKVERLSRTEKLFATPMFSDFLVDQSTLMNRRRDKEDKKSNAKTTFVPHIIACATMWHETRPEMLEMLKSIMRMDQDQYLRKSGAENLQPDPEETNCYTFETHIFFDDAFEVEDEETGNMVINSFVRDLIQSMNKAKNAVYKLPDIHINPPQKTGTPYGGRLTYTLPYKTMMYVHLKNKDKIRHRKRWSQVMYMYYLLGYNIMQKEQLTIAEKLKKADNTFLLALDGDIDFKPEAVILLVDLMKKNSDLGAACGRIHPIGSGFMVWYQEFEYAIGHWLQKATEHMIGCVLCSPGCFSLFRAGALMAENVMKTYTTKAEEARHYVQYDQGEDRWLCTLLLQRGYRVEYSAASDAYTHCPESFNEFYTQRRRWVPSTMANILDLLCDYKNIVKINNHISLLYISYQFMLMIGTVLGPGTIFLLLVSAFNAAFKIDNWTSFLYNMIPIVLYVVICLSMTGKIQLFSALILSAVYGLIMMAVLVGMLMQISEDGYLAPSTIFLYIVAGEIIIAGLIHPQEILCLFRGPIYYVTIPSMYLLLIIYSVCNLNIVAWGTREVKQKRTKAELEEEKKAAEEAEKKKKKEGSFHSILSNFGKKKKEEEGAVEFSLGNLFKFMLCTKPKEDTQTKELVKMNDTLEMVGKRLERLERGLEWSPAPARIHRSSSRTSVDNVDSETKEGTERRESEVQVTKPEEEEEEERDDLTNPYWIEDEILKKSELVVMDVNETTFWKDLIKEYLYPLMEDKNKKEEISKALKELRDQCVMTFFMLNALFVIVVFLLQLNKSQVHINWPLDAKVNMTIDENKHILLAKTHLQLEPVGVLFIVFFAIILVIQFLAMIFHRFETMCHLLSSATLFSKRKKSFESKLKEGKKQLWKNGQQDSLSSFPGVKRQTMNVQEATDRIFSEMKHKEDLDKLQKEEKRRSSRLLRFAQSALESNPISRSRYSQFRNSTRLEQVVEEGSDT